MNNWEILGIEETKDIGIIKKAYAEKTKIYHPETHPEEFKQLHTAYKALVSKIRTGANITTSYVIEQADPIIPTSVMKPTPIVDEAPAAISADEEFLAQIEQEFDARSQEMYKDPMIIKLRNMLEEGAYYPHLWKSYFASPEFLERQYNPKFIDAMADIIERMMEKPDDEREGRGRIPQYCLVYIVMAYGCLFENVGTCIIRENVYKRNLLTKLKKAFGPYVNKYSAYKVLETNETYLGQRYAFYVYRNILEILECENPDRDKLRFWLTDGFAKINRTHMPEITHITPPTGVSCHQVMDVLRYLPHIRRSSLIFELMAFLVSRISVNRMIFVEILKEVCEMDTEDKAEEEKEILMLMIEEKCI